MDKKSITQLLSAKGKGKRNAEHATVSTVDMEAVSAPQRRAFLFAVQSIVTQRESMYVTKLKIEPEDTGASIGFGIETLQEPEQEQEHTDKTPQHREQEGKGQGGQEPQYQTIHDLIDEVNGWALCLNSIPMHYMRAYPHATLHMMQIAAFMNQRVIYKHLLGSRNESGGLGCSTNTDLAVSAGGLSRGSSTPHGDGHVHALVLLLARADVCALIHEHVTYISSPLSVPVLVPALIAAPASSVTTKVIAKGKPLKVPADTTHTTDNDSNSSRNKDGCACTFTETDWMSLCTFTRHNLLQSSCFSSLLDAITSTLATTVDMTSTTWNSSLGLNIRYKIENILSILHYIAGTATGTGAADAAFVYTYMHAGSACGMLLFQLVACLERGVISDEQQGQGPGGVSESDSEGDEEINSPDKVTGAGIGIVTGMSVCSTDTTAAIYPRPQPYLYASGNDNSNSNNNNNNNNNNIDMDKDRDILADMQVHVRTRLLKHHRRAERNMPPYRGQWCDLCMTSIVSLIMHVQTQSHPHTKVKATASTGAQSVAFASTSVRNNAHTPNVASVSQIIQTNTQKQLQSDIIMLSSPCWQLRLLSLTSLQLLIQMPISTLAGVGVGAASKVFSDDKDRDKRGNGDSGNSVATATATNATTISTNNSKVSRSSNSNKATNVKGEKTDSRATGNGKEKILPNTSSSSGAAGAVMAIRNGYSHSRNRNSSIRPVEELCQSGYIRSLCWNTLNFRGDVRIISAKVLDSIVKATEKEKVGTEVWAAVVEQGLVPLLEIIQQGIPICPYPYLYTYRESSSGAGLTTSTQAVKSDDNREKSGELFPEHTVRCTIQTLLLSLCQHLEASPTLRLRLSSALLHSGNQTLRMNIFSGILYINTRMPTLGKSLWGLNTPSQSADGINSTGTGTGTADDSESRLVTPTGNGKVFLDMLHTLAREPLDLKPLLAVMAHVMRSSTQLREKMEKQVSSAAVAFARALNEKDQGQEQGQRHGQKQVSSKGIIANAHKAASSDRLQGGATVLVDDSGQLVKMRCPAPAVIEEHSPAFALLLATGSTSTGAGAGVATETQPNGTKVVGSGSLIILAGKYSLWQEIFSHMLHGDDNYLFEQSILRMPATAIIDAFQIARRFHLHILLEKYAKAMSKRINMDTVVSTLEAALGRDGDSLEGATKITVVEGAITHIPLHNSCSISVSGSGSGYDILPKPISDMSSAVTSTYSTEMYPPSPTVRQKQPILMPMPKKMMHVRLTSQCLDYMESNVEQCFSRRRPVRLAELTVLLHDVLSFMFNTS